MAIFFENWDGVTAPLLPTSATWNIDSAFTTTTTIFGMTPVSSPNVLTLGGFSASFKYATYINPDGNGGNVSVAGTFSFSGHFNPPPPDTDDWQWAVLARGSASTLSASTTQYEGTIDVQRRGFSSGVVASIFSRVSGVQTSLGSIAPDIVKGFWYFPTLTCNGTNISLTIQRQSDGWWVNSSGLWQAGAATAISVTDSSITGSGYAGLAMYTSSTDNVNADNWTFSNYTPQTPLSYRQGSSALYPVAIPTIDLYDWMD